MSVEESGRSFLGRRGLVLGVETDAGSAIASALGTAGADLALATMRADEGVLVARRLQRQLRELGRQASTYAFDVTLGQNVKVSTRQVAKELGGLDFVVSAPDEPLVGPFERLTDSDLARVTTVNFYAHVYAVRAALDEFRRGGEGHALLVVRRSEDGGAAYQAAQAATLSLVTTLADELRERAVTISALIVPANIGGARAGRAALELLQGDPARASGRVYDLAARPEGAADHEGRP